MREYLHGLAISVLLIASCVGPVDREEAGNSTVIDVVESGLYQQMVQDASSGSGESLDQLMKLARRTDGYISELHGATLHALLCRLGDNAFAEGLRRQGSDVQDRIRDLLTFEEFAGGPRYEAEEAAEFMLQKRYPLTMGARPARWQDRG